MASLEWGPSSHDGVEIVLDLGIRQFADSATMVSLPRKSGNDSNASDVVAHTMGSQESVSTRANGGYSLCRTYPPRLFL